MKKVLILLAVILGLIIVGVIATNLLTPWMDRWGATDEEIAATFPGDELVPAPASFVNRAITIQAAPEAIYPWIVQLDAEKGGWYSYDWLETNLLRCPMVNADRIHPEWQDRQAGDTVNMCPDGSDRRPIRSRRCTRTGPWSWDIRKAINGWICRSSSSHRRPTAHPA